MLVRAWYEGSFKLTRVNEMASDRKWLGSGMEAGNRGVPANDKLAGKACRVAEELAENWSTGTDPGQE